MTTKLQTLIAKASTLLDYDPVTGILRWNTDISRKVRKGTVAGYTRQGDQRRVLGFKNSSLLCSKIIWYKMTGTHVDFVLYHNGDKSDLRFVNLLGVSKAKASLHYMSTDASGIFFDKKSKKYRAFVQIHSKRQYFGSHDTCEEASQARVDGIKKLII